ncbi:MAG: hypothetical protein ACOY3P_02510, partial [Planctomycetota bacterium]
MSRPLLLLVTAGWMVFHLFAAVQPALGQPGAAPRAGFVVRAPSERAHAGLAQVLMADDAPLHQEDHLLG